jgi:hypothetical protein
MPGKIINGLLYDTDVAEMVLSQPDPPRNVLALYRTVNGRWFSYWREFIGPIPRWEIDEVTEERAKTALSRHEKYAEFFGEPKAA